MKLKSKLIWMLAIPALFMFSCGGEEESTDEENTSEEVEEGPSFKDECTTDNDVFLQIERYGYSFDSTFVYNGKIKIVRSEWNISNDSTATLKLYNYELGAADTATNFQIMCEFHSKNGKSLANETYNYLDYEQDYWAKVNIISPLGTVWFNWASGMPDQGYAKLNYFSEDGACGEFSLEVNEPKWVTYGHVVLKGPFKTL